MNHDGISVTAMIVLASFAIERLKAGVLFLVSGPESWQKIFPDPALLQNGRERSRAQRKVKVLEFVVAGILAMAALGLLPGVRILEALGVQGSGDLLDFALTWLVLTAGADQLGDLLKSRSDSADSIPQPQQIVITGDLQLIDKNDALKRGSA